MLDKKRERAEAEESASVCDVNTSSGRASRYRAPAIHCICCMAVSLRCIRTVSGTVLVYFWNGGVTRGGHCICAVSAVSLLNHCCMCAVSAVSAVYLTSLEGFRIFHQPLRSDLLGSSIH
eukprot:6471419-Prymnesium_polylepis.1